MGMFCPQAIKDNRTGGEVGGLFPCVVLGRLETRNPMKASRRAEQDFYDQIWFSRIRSLSCQA